MDIKEQILVALGLNKTEEELKLAWQAKSEDGTIFVSTAEELENGVDISVLTEDGTTIPLPIGTYKTDTGVSFRVEEEGVVGEVIESETEEDEEVDARKEKDDKEGDSVKSGTEDGAKGSKDSLFLKRVKTTSATIISSSLLKIKGILFLLKLKL